MNWLQILTVNCLHLTCTKSLTWTWDGSWDTIITGGVMEESTWLDNCPLRSQDTPPPGQSWSQIQLRMDENIVSEYSSLVVAIFILVSGIFLRYLVKRMRKRKVYTLPYFISMYICNIDHWQFLSPALHCPQVYKERACRGHNAIWAGTKSPLKCWSTEKF